MKLLYGTEINVGWYCPVVNVVAQDLSDIQVGGEKRKSSNLVVVPSLDTPVCAAETRKFNEEAKKIEKCRSSCVSMDLPFAMKDFVQLKELRT